MCVTHAFQLTSVNKVLYYHRPLQNQNASLLPLCRAELCTAKQNFYVKINVAQPNESKDERYR